MAKFEETKQERVFKVTLSETEIRAILSARAALQNDKDPMAESDFNVLSDFWIEAKRELND